MLQNAFCKLLSTICSSHFATNNLRGGKYVYVCRVLFVSVRVRVRIRVRMCVYVFDVVVGSPPPFLRALQTHTHTHTQITQTIVMTKVQNSNIKDHTPHDYTSYRVEYD